MLMADTDADHRLLAIARAVESLLSPAPDPDDPR
jgi:hypothetical protein